MQAEAPHPDHSRNAAIVAGGTLVSRILGFARDMLLAHLLGAGADAFLVAFRVPNFFRRLLAEGSLGMAHAAAFARTAASDGLPEALRLSRSVFTALLLLSLPVTLALVPAAKPLIFLMAPGFVADPELLGTAARLLQYCLPYLPLCTLAAVGFSTRACLGDFTPQAFAPALLNCVMLATGFTALSLSLSASSVEQLFCAGVVLGGAAQLAVLGRGENNAGHTDSDSAASRTGFDNNTGQAGFDNAAKKFPCSRFYQGLLQSIKGCSGKRIRTFLGYTFRPEVRAVLRRTPLVALGAAPHQLQVLAGTMAASFAVPGSISALYFAERIVELPLGLAGVAVGIVALPRLASFAAKRDKNSFAETLTTALSLTAFFSFPAAAGLLGMALPITDLLFGHGAYGEAGTLRTAHCLAAYALGLPAMCASRPLLAAVAALGDTRQPLAAALKSLFVVLTVGPTAMIFLGAAGVGLGIAAGAWVNAYFLLRRITAEGVPNPVRTLRKQICLYFAAAYLMGATLVFLQPFSTARTAAALQITAVVGACITLWVGLFFAAGNKDARALADMLRMRHKK